MSPEEKQRMVKITEERKGIVDKIEKQSKKKLNQLDKVT